jgi:hypothetical protein
MHHADTAEHERFVELVTAAHAYLTARQERLRGEFRLGEYERYAMVDDGRVIEFSTGGIARVRATVQFVGSISRTTGTWLWGWANPEVPEELVHDVRDVRLHGEAQGLWQLTTPKWEADEVDGWEMTSIAAYVLRAAGAYRAPTDELFSFLLFRDVAWVDASG